MAKYAAKTVVTVSQSQQHIKRVLERYEVEAWTTGTVTGKDGSPPRSFIGFQVDSRPYRVELRMPDREKFSFTKTGARKSPTQAEKSYKQEVRRLWRVMELYLKATLEAVSEGVVSLDEAFMPYRILADNRTVREVMVENMDLLHQRGELPKLLMGG